MSKRSRGCLVVEMMTIELEIKTAFSKLASAIAQYNDESADIDKIKAYKIKEQFKEITDRTVRDFEQDLLIFPADLPEEHPKEVVERRIKQFSSHESCQEYKG